MTGKSQYEARLLRDRERAPGRIEVSSTTKPRVPAQPAEEGPSWRIGLTVGWFVLVAIIALASGYRHHEGGEPGHDHVETKLNESDDRLRSPKAEAPIIPHAVHVK
jgi:hypothetical protein